ncbi:MAG: bifunctional phosphoglucose/phosphomannose isomerase [Microscillaceae bacterium]
MYDLILGFPEQLQKALALGTQIKTSTPKHEIRNVLIGGLGGSGIGASIVESLLASHLRVPYSITKTYDVPAFVDAHTLFIASTFSGNTEETLAALEEARQRGAHIFCLTSGGKALALAQQEGYDFVQMPNEAPCPRAFLGYSLVQLLHILPLYGLTSTHLGPDLETAQRQLAQNQADIQTQAKALAQTLVNKLPIVYGDTKIGPVLVRLQQQINENAKQLCHINIFPEMNHNELVGWGLPAEHYQNTVVWMVKTDFDHPRVRTRMEICQTIFSAKTSALYLIQAEGQSLTEQVIYLIHLFDWVSYYLAEQNQVDAFEIDVINFLKNELAKI